MKDNKIDLDNIEIVNGQPRMVSTSSDAVSADPIPSEKTSPLENPLIEKEILSPVKTKYAWLTKPNKFTIGLAIFLAISLPITSIILGYLYGKVLLDSQNAEITNNLINKTNVTWIGNFKVALKDTKETVNDMNAFKYTPMDKMAGMMGPGGTIFKGDTDMDKELTYYNVGKILDGKYEDYNLAYGFSKDIGLFNGRFPLAFAYYDISSEIILFDTNVYQDESGKDIPYKYVPNVIMQSNVVRDTDPSIYSYLAKANLKVTGISVTQKDTAVYDIPEGLMTASIMDENNQQIYKYSKDTEGAVYTKTPEGFYKAYYANPSFDASRIVWSKALTTVSSTYTYKSIGGCFRYKIETVVPDFDLLETGKTQEGYTIMEAKDYKKDTFIKHLYDEDYIKGEIYKYNEDTKDDKTPYTFDIFTKRHPVFYWKDPFNRYIRFVSNDYVFAGGCAKPAIYLYPETTTQVSVNIKVDGMLGHTSPLYKDGWNITANPNGDLTSNGKTYDYLYWDGQFNQYFERNDGYLIKSEELDTKLSQVLIDLGFNEKEKNQFVEYWLPIMQKENKAYYFVTFVDEKILDQVAPLTVSPKPESYKRYFMLFKGENTYREVPKLQMDKFERHGYTLFEWGGAKNS